MELISTLQKLGLSKKEAQVYLTLLSLGKTTGYQVAKKSTLDRSTTYFLLRELRKKGLVLQAPHASKQYFVAKNPQTFIEEKKEDIFSAESILPQLLKMTQYGQSVQTLHFEGANGSRESLIYVLDRSTSKHADVFFSYTPGGPTGDIVKSVQATFAAWQKYNMTVRGIAPDVDEVPKYFLPETMSYGWDIRLMPIEKYDLRSSFVVIDNFVRILSRSRGMAVVIENDELADIARHIFSIVWPIARVVDDSEIPKIKK